uniref:Proline-rich protein 35 n=1 Tax=Danio rerio TaxID=7955 RepID=A0A8M9Q444_DANRE|nr:proline-rich protein 35 [Danio rerio]XP_021329486.1 proline-rich protein 35 [Danio rerio]|eukprot:XP_021326077.1 proline-rich protein 35 [Danio rerio]
MSKDNCKQVGCKHKERKPKKPHYIPRPWGKPYNYKCFQCPFTCMEKSHLYNHMKYSLCKNSLSLLIESDWPYKKDQLRLQQVAVRSRSPAKAHSEQATTPDEPSHSSANLEEEETEKRDEKDEDIQEANAENPSETCSRRAKPSKQEAELVMADMFSLEEQLLRARSVEVESKLRHYRLSKTCLSGPAALLSEQWRILSNQTSNVKPKPDVAAPSLPCYPPVSTSQIECSDPPAFNLSLLGVGYPLAPGLLSYLNPTLSNANPSNAPLPFLASQLAHSQRHSERSLLPPHLYYPFLCEHTFGATPSSSASEASKLIKAPSVGLQPPSYPPKLSLWKVPALRPSSSQSSPAAVWTSPTHSSPEPGLGALQERVRDRKSSWQQETSSLKRTAMAGFDTHGAPVEKKPALEIGLETLKNTQKPASIAALMSSRMPIHNSAGSSPLHLSEQLEARQRGMERESALLQDFSALLQEYQLTEQRAASLPEQCHLWAHLGKIRTELSHIQQALERTARSNEGPLDLSVKKDHPLIINAIPGETKDEDCSETEDEDDDDDDDEDDGKDRRKCSLDALMKLNPLVKTEVLTGSAEALWHSRTTKCEADSSVLLCSKTPNRPPSIQHLDTLCPSSPLTTTDTLV